MGGSSAKECVSLFDDYWNDGKFNEAVALHEPTAVIIDCGEVHEEFAGIKGVKRFAALINRSPILATARSSQASPA
jgi:hypothetical protein